MASTRNFADVIRAKIAANLDLAEKIAAESFNADIAMKVYEARTAAKLSQKKLAELAGTQQSVISRIEDADYDGHSLKLLNRIAEALGMKLGVEFYACASPSEAGITETFSPDWKYAGEWQISSCESMAVDVASVEAVPLLPPIKSSSGHELTTVR